MTATPRLDDLISAIENRHDDPLSQLTDAVVLGQHLDELADHLIGHFVDRARRSGASWTNIGQSMGVTKQAAQKRFVPSEPATAEGDLRVFARYDDAARSAIVEAQEVARRAKSGDIKPVHLLLALLRDESLADLLDVAAARAALEGGLETGDAELVGHIPFAGASKKVLELAHRAGLSLQDEHIGPEHLLLGVLGVPDEPQISALGLDRDGVQARVRARTE
ncbi:Clp protease N-terminal domain-containing protein [Actinokineospora sp. NBRC 105648]|uniref:Clp protease N-terminal domain-containing protein n=1 Tax=Actinokineospora sp. NBRC 105648 TaxID=3032206 RepID=UPI0024A02F4A|nr:Clp protease N-terminal domain-containing protein [Actinokineospora sp. NBRC 105648]GLZ41198.1 hypothetical protein Acsp05_48220 [Actinokineospora sp. NBRC 105648]